MTGEDVFIPNHVRRPPHIKPSLTSFLRGVGHYARTCFDLTLNTRHAAPSAVRVLRETDVDDDETSQGEIIILLSGVLLLPSIEKEDKGLHDSLKFYYMN